jgi:hypothetical protein
VAQLRQHHRAVPLLLVRREQFAGGGADIGQRILCRGTEAGQAKGEGSGEQDDAAPTGLLMPGWADLGERIEAGRAEAGQVNGGARMRPGGAGRVNCRLTRVPFLPAGAADWKNPLSAPM